VIDLDLDQSFAAVGSCYDNAAVESFFATLKRELAWIHHTKTWPNRALLRSAIFDYMRPSTTISASKPASAIKALYTSKRQLRHNPVATRPGQPQTLADVVLCALEPAFGVTMSPS
jgi:hypothetical protein